MTLRKKLTNVQRYRRYGWTENQVRGRLEKVDFCGRPLYVHRLIAAPLQRVENRIRDYEKRHKLAPWVPDRIESFNWRLSRSGKFRSMHSWAIALDINPASNPMKSHRPYRVSPVRIPSYVRSAFKGVGFVWGGDWNSPYDPMHFEWPF